MLRHKMINEFKSWSREPLLNWQTPASKVAAMTSVFSLANDYVFIDIVHFWNIRSHDWVVYSGQKEERDFDSVHFVKYISLIKVIIDIFVELFVDDNSDHVRRVCHLGALCCVFLF